MNPVELETLKFYIKNYIKTGFILSSKFLAGVFILFNIKYNGSLHLFVDYEELNNLTIKNCYLFLLMGKSLDRIDQAKHFTQVDLISVYYQMRIQNNDKWKTAL